VAHDISHAGVCGQEAADEENRLGIDRAMSSYIACFLINFIYIFLKANQQLNVVKNRYSWVMPTSIAMGLCEVGTVLLVVLEKSILLGVVTGVAGGLGCVLAMRMHFGGR
jgi:hypothetical protein